MTQSNKFEDRQYTLLLNKKLLEVMDKYDKQDILEISDQIQLKSNCFEKIHRINLKLSY
jgi:hypothetical protein